MALQVGSMFLFSYSFCGYLYWKNRLGLNFIHQDLFGLLLDSFDVIVALVMLTKWFQRWYGGIYRTYIKALYVIKIILMYCTLKYMLLS